MTILTFGEIISFENGHYIWLAFDPEEKTIHLAKILDEELTRKLMRLDENQAKKHSFASNAPILAYVILTTENFAGRAAFLRDSDRHIEDKDNFNTLGRMINKNDLLELKTCILKGDGLPSKLVKLIKKLGS